MTNKEKFLALVSGSEPETMAAVKERNRNRAMIEESQAIALKVLVRLDDLKWSQKQLAEKMGVTPQQVNKIVKGQENMTLATLVKLQEILNIPLLVSSIENDLEGFFTSIIKAFKQGIEKPKGKIINLADYQQSVSVDSSSIQMEEPKINYEIYTQQA